MGHSVPRVPSLFRCSHHPGPSPGLPTVAKVRSVELESGVKLTGCNLNINGKYCTKNKRRLKVGREGETEESFDRRIYYFLCDFEYFIYILEVVVVVWNLSMSIEHIKNKYFKNISTFHQWSKVVAPKPVTLTATFKLTINYKQQHEWAVLNCFKFSQPLKCHHCYVHLWVGYFFVVIAWLRTSCFHQWNGRENINGASRMGSDRVSALVCTPHRSHGCASEQPCAPNSTQIPLLFACTTKHFLSTPEWYPGML